MKMQMEQFERGIWNRSVIIIMVLMIEGLEGYMNRIDYSYSCFTFVCGDFINKMEQALNKFQREGERNGKK